MNNREIKFRVWDNVDYMTTFTLQDLQERKIQFTSDCPVMQFTGLHDKNGVEIYEGDILKYSYSRDTTGKDVVEFTEIVEWDNYTDDIVGFSIHQAMEHEIIGNLYENPDLISKSPPTTPQK